MSYWKWESITLTNSLAEQILSAQEIFLVMHSFNYYSIGWKLSIPYETMKQRGTQSIDQNCQNFVPHYKWENHFDQLISWTNIICTRNFYQLMSFNFYSIGWKLSTPYETTNQKRHIINWSKYFKYFCQVESERGTLANSLAEQILSDSFFQFKIF